MTDAGVHRFITAGAIAVVLTLVAGPATAQDIGVFVSSTTTDGNIGGLAGADAICQGLGQAAFPGSGPWVAWLSDSATDARDRIAIPGGGGAYVLASQPATVIASDLADLTDGSIAIAINLTESGTAVVANTFTGTASDGTRSTYPAQASDYCADWTSSSDTIHARYGVTTLTSAAWTDVDGATPFPAAFGRCDGGASIPIDPKRLYCFGPMAAPVPSLPQPALIILGAVLLAGGAYLQQRRRAAA